MFKRGSQRGSVLRARRVLVQSNQRSESLKKYGKGGIEEEEGGRGV